MGKAKRTRISQRMSQHIMLLKLALRIRSSAVITYQVDMFISQNIPLVKAFLNAPHHGCGAWIAGSAFPYSSSALS